jgi:hypothetical protein
MSLLCLIGGEAQGSLGRGTERLDKPALVEDHPSRREQSHSEMAMAYLKNQIILIQGVILATCISHCIDAGRTV